MATLQKLHRRLAFADAALAGNQHAFAVHLHEHGVAGNPGCQEGFEVRNDGGNHGTGGFIAAQYGNVMLFRHLHQLLVRLNIPGNEHSRGFEGQETVINPASLEAGKFIQVAGLHVADHLEPHRLKVLEKACQLQAGSGHILHRQVNLLIIRGGIGHPQIKFLYQFGKGYTVNFHIFCPIPANYPHYNDPIREYQYYFEETKIFSKNTCFFQETLLLYVGTCLEVPFRHVFLRIGGAVNGEV